MPTIAELVKQKNNSEKPSYFSEYFDSIREAGASAESKSGAIGAGVLASVGKPLGDFIGQPIKNQIDNLRLGAKQFEDGIKQYSEIQKLQQKPIVDLTPTENDTLTEFYKLSKQTGFNISQISDDKKNLLLGIQAKQDQYEAYKNEVMGYEGKTTANFAGQAFGEIADKITTGRRDGDENIAERISLGLAGAVKATTDIVVGNRTPLDENERMYAIWNNAELSNFDKIVAQAESFKKSLNFDIKFDSDKYAQRREELLLEASNKIGEGLSATNTDSTFSRTGKVMGGYVDFFFASVMPLFEEEVSGATTESAGALFATPFTMLMNTASESLQALGTDKETADNWGLLVGTVGPAFMRLGKKPNEIAKEVSTETKFIASLPKEYQKMYVDARTKTQKIQQMGEQISRETLLQERIVLGEKTGTYNVGVSSRAITNIRSLGENFIISLRNGKFNEAAEIYKNIDSQYSTISKNYTPSKKVNPFLNKRGSISPQAVIQDIQNFNLSDKVNYNAIKKVIDSFDVGFLGDISKTGIAASILKNTKDLQLSNKERDIMVENMYNALQEKKESILKNTKDMWDYQENKKNAKEVMQEMKDVSPEEFEIAKREYETKYKDTLGDETTPANTQKYELIQKLLEDGVYKHTNNVIIDGYLHREYSISEAGLWTIPKNKQSNATAIVHYPEYLAKEFDAKFQVEKYISKTYQDALFEPKDIIKKTQLEKNIQASGLTPERYVRESLDKLFINKRELIGQMESEIKNSQKGERVYLESDVGGSPDVIGISSTFPKWIPEKLRNYDSMVSVWEQLMRGNLTIPKRQVRKRQLMETYLERLGSPLKEIYDIDKKDITKKSTVTRDVKEVKGQLLQTKRFARAYYNEYKKVNRQVVKLEQTLSNLKENATETRVKLRAKIDELRDVYKNRRKIINAIKEEYQLTPAEFDTLSKTKDYLKFKDEYTFKQFAFELEMKAFEVQALRIYRLEVQKKIEEKHLRNIENVFRAFELPTTIDKFTEKDLLVLEDIIENSKEGDIFIGKGYMKRFGVIEEGAGIRTIREVMDAIEKDIPGVRDLISSMESATMDLYHSAIRDMNSEISELYNQIKKTDDQSEKNRLSEQIQDIQSQISDLSDELKSYQDSTLEQTNFMDKSQKSKEKIVSEKKYSTGNVLDKAKYDTALADKDLYFGFVVKLYTEKKIKYDREVLKIEDRVAELLKESRKSHGYSISDIWKPTKIKDKLIPTDDHIIRYMESDIVEQVKMSMNGEITQADKNLIDYMIRGFQEMGEILLERRVMDGLLNKYITHMDRPILQQLKYKGIDAAIKQIFTKEDRVFDFGALGDRDQVLGLEKYFRFAQKRTGMQDYNMNVGQIFMGYTRTFYKKLGLDETINKAVLYGDILADSGSQKVMIAWINNKKGIRSDDLQGSGIDKVISGLNYAIVLKDLGWSVPAAMFSIIGALGANVALLGEGRFIVGQKRKYTSQGKKILKDFEGTLGRNPLWNIKNDLLNRPDITPLEIPLQMAFSLMGQVFKSALNTAFLGLLTKAEFETGKISDSRAAEIMLKIGEFHSTPGTKSVYGSTLVGKTGMTYKGWAVPLLTTSIESAKTITGIGNKSQRRNYTRKEAAMNLLRLYGYSFAIIYTIYSMYGEEDEDISEFFKRIPYGYRRFLNEAASSTSAINPLTWLAMPRLPQFVGDFFKYTGETILLQEYKTDDKDKDGDYDKGDLKGIEHLKKLFTPGALKQIDIINELLQTGDDSKKPETKTREERLQETGSRMNNLDRISDRLNRLQ